MNIYYIRRHVNEKDHERDLDFGEQSSSLCSSLSSGFDFVEFTVKKKKNFFMILLRGLFSFVLFSLIPFLCFVFFSRLYAKTNLLSAESSFTFFTCKMHFSFHFILKAMFLLLFNFPLSPF